MRYLLYRLITQRPDKWGLLEYLIILIVGGVTWYFVP